jgi:hypothetical protein
MVHRTEQVPGDGARAGEATSHAAGAVIDELRRDAHVATQRARQLLTTPAIGATVAGVAVMVAGAAWGVSEAALAAVTAYVVFRMLTRRRRGEEAERGPRGPTGP